MEQNFYNSIYGETNKTIETPKTDKGAYDKKIQVHINKQEKEMIKAISKNERNTLSSVTAKIISNSLKSKKVKNPKKRSNEIKDTKLTIYLNEKEYQEIVNYVNIINYSKEGNKVSKKPTSTIIGNLMYDLLYKTYKKIK